jgi:putative membrane protein
VGHAAGAEGVWVDGGVRGGLAPAGGESGALQRIFGGRVVLELAAATAGFSAALQGFFLGCVIVAAIFGAATAKRSILFVQGGPAIVAMAALIADALSGG